MEEPAPSATSDHPRPSAAPDQSKSPTEPVAKDLSHSLLLLDPEPDPKPPSNLPQRLTFVSGFGLFISFCDVLVIPVFDLLTTLVFLFYLCYPEVLHCIDFVQANDTGSRSIFAASLSGNEMLGLNCLTSFLYFVDVALIASRLLIFMKGRYLQGFPLDKGPLPLSDWASLKKLKGNLLRGAGMCQALMAFVKVEDEQQRDLYKCTLPRWQNLIFATVADTIQIVVDISYLYFTGSGSWIALASLVIALISLIDAWSLEIGWAFWVVFSFCYRLCCPPKSEATSQLTWFPKKGHMAVRYWPFRWIMIILLLLAVLLAISLDSFSPGLIYGAGVTYLTQLDAQLIATCIPDYGNGRLGDPISYKLPILNVYNDTAFRFETDMRWKGFFFYSSVTSNSDLFGGDDPDLSGALGAQTSKRLRDAMNVTAPFASYNVTERCRLPNQENCLSDPKMIRDQTPLYMAFVPALRGIALALQPPSKNSTLAKKGGSANSTADVGHKAQRKLEAVYLDLGYDTSGAWVSHVVTPPHPPTWKVLCPPPQPPTIVFSGSATRAQRLEVLNEAFEAYMNQTMTAPLGIPVSLAINISMAGEFCDGY